MFLSICVFTLRQTLGVILQHRPSDPGSQGQAAPPRSFSRCAAVPLCRAALCRGRALAVRRWWPFGRLWSPQLLMALHSHHFLFLYPFLR